METINNIPQQKPSLEIKSVGPRVRSIAYPSYSLQFCYELTLKIHQTFGNTTFNTREEIASHLGVSASHLMTQLSSCVQYGLLDIKSKEGYKPTPLFTILYRPLNDEEKRTGQLQSFASPEIYKKLISQFNNQSLPSQGGLATILLRNYKVSEAAAPQAAKIFLENITDLGLIDSDKTFRLGGVIAEIAESGEPIGHVVFNTERDKTDNSDTLLQIKALAKEVKTINYVPENTKNNDGNPVIPIFFKDGREAKIVLPNKFTNEDFNKIVKILTAYIDD